jgi:CubicO group peptidase (beta-lactamase class C family)
MIRPCFYGMLLMLFCAPSFAAPLPDASSRLSSVARRFHEVTRFSGAVLVMQGEKVLLCEGYGLSDREHGIECSSTTKFRLASVTKQFTATAVLRLVQDEKIELQAPISKYLPELNPAIASRVTVHQLLSHTSGLIRDVETLGDKDMGDHLTIAEMLGLIGGSELQTEPEADYSYSNTGYVLLAAVIEKVTGKSYGQAMTDLFFDPLEMKNTGHEMAGRLLPGRARGYSLLPDGAVNAPYEDKSYVTGAGSLYSTVDDLGMWIRAVKKHAVLSPKMTERLFTAYTPQYGYGWVPFEYQTRAEKGVLEKFQGWGHDGACPGFLTQISLYPEQNISVIFLSNSQPAPIPTLLEQLANVLLGNEVSYPLEPVADAIFREALGCGVAAAVGRWQALKESLAPGLPTPEHMNGTGYRYLRSHQLDKALRVFQLQVAVFPENANAHDSLGEAYLEMGQRDSGIACYRRALELDPSRQSSRQVLEGLGVEVSSRKQ